MSRSPKSRTFRITAFHEGSAACGVNLLSILFACAACSSIGIVTIHADEAGIELSNYVDCFLPKKSSRCRVLIERLAKSEVQITCACGQRGRTVLDLFLGQQTGRKKIAA